jgi:hypothetical protein
VGRPGGRVWLAYFCRSTARLESPASSDASIANRNRRREDRAERVPHGHVGRAFRKSGACYAGGLFGDRIYGTRMKAHDLLREGGHAAFPSVCADQDEFASSNKSSTEPTHYGEVSRGALSIRWRPPRHFLHYLRGVLAPRNCCPHSRSCQRSRRPCLCRNRACPAAHRHRR